MRIDRKFLAVDFGEKRLVVVIHFVGNVHTDIGIELSFSVPESLVPEGPGRALHVCEDTRIFRPAFLGCYAIRIRQYIFQ